jgi:hypothetical protein
MYDAGTATSATLAGATQTLTDVSKIWAINRWVTPGKAYSITNVSNGGSFTILSNTSTTATPRNFPLTGSTDFVWTVGDPYFIASATHCLDSPLWWGGDDFGGLTVPAIHANTQVSEPMYLWNNTGVAPTVTYVSTPDLNLLINRDFYVETPTFDGTSGVGMGTLANRPNTCTPQVGYFATDQGNWNTSGNGFGQGQLYTCTSPNVWTLTYTPFTYPHPLIH